MALFDDMMEEDEYLSGELTPMTSAIPPVDNSQYAAPVAPSSGAFETLMDPSFQAGAGQAMNNIMRMRRGGMPGVSPMVAYQQSVLQQAKHQQDMDTSNPFYEYETARERGYIPEDMDYTTFQQSQYRMGATDTAKIREFQQWQTLNPGASQEEQQKTWNEILARSQVTDIGGGGKVAYNPVTGRMETIVSAADATGREADEKSAVTTAGKVAEAQANQDAEFRQAAATLPEFEQSLADTRQLLTDIQSGKFQETGYFEGRVARFTDEKTAELAAKQVLQTLKNLQITNLAPVTEAEIRLIEDLYASVLKDPEANVGALNAAIDMMEKKVELINRMGKYWVGNEGTLRDYGFDERWAQEDDPIIP